MPPPTDGRPSLSGGMFAGGATVYPSSTRGKWITLHSNLEAAAESAANLLRPLAAAGTDTKPALIQGPCTRFLARVKYDAGQVVTTSPVVRFYAVWCHGSGTNHDSPFVDDSTFRVMRVDNADNNASGVSLTCVADADIRDTTFAFSDAISLTGTDLLGAWWLLALTETAASIAGSNAVTLEAMALN